MAGGRRPPKNPVPWSRRHPPVADDLSRPIEEMLIGPPTEPTSSGPAAVATDAVPAAPSPAPAAAAGGINPDQEPPIVVPGADPAELNGTTSKPDPAAPRPAIPPMKEPSMTQPSTALALTPKTILDLAASETVPEVLKDYFPDEKEWTTLPAAARVNAIEFLLEEMKGTTEGLPSITFPVIKYPTSGQSFWEVPGANGETEPVKTVEGVVVFKQLVRVYYPWGQAVSKNPPTCASLDLIKPSADIKEPQDKGKGCAHCEQAQWGTAKNQAGTLTRGQACKQRLRTFLLRPGEEIPMLLSLPPTALKSFSNYAVQLRQAKASLLGVVTTFGLADAKSGDGTDYKVVTLKVGGRVPYTDMQRVANVRAAFEEQMRRRGIQADEADGAHHVDDAPPAGTPQVLAKTGQVLT